MEYPFKDLLPLDEVLAREGYYKDWTHLDPETFYSITQISEMIKTKGYGADVRLLISQLAEHFGLSVVEVTDIANELIARQDAVEDFNNQVIQEMTDKDVISAPEIIAARGGKPTLGQRLDETTAQLEQLSRIKIFDRIPTEADLAEGEFGAVIASLWPWVYAFGGINGQNWDSLKFDTKKYEATSGLMDKLNSFARLQDGAGVIKVKKTASAGLATVEQKLTTDLNFTNGRKYGIKFDVKRSIVDGTNRGNCGISISPLQNPATYYPFTYTLTDGIALMFGGGYTSGKNDVSVNYRNGIDGVQTTQNLAIGGGLTKSAASYLYFPEGEWLSVEVIVSINSLQVIINGTEYVNTEEEDLSKLNAPDCKVVIWGMNNDANSLEVNHYFDNLIIDEVV